MSDQTLSVPPTEEQEKILVLESRPGPKYKSAAYIGEVLLFKIITPRPNWFRRLCYWAILGWRWESLE